MNKAVSLLLSIALYAAASDTNASMPPRGNAAGVDKENNITAVGHHEMNTSTHSNTMPGSAHCRECAAAAASADSGTNWLFYRDVLSGMDRIQHYLSHKVTVFSSNLDRRFSSSDDEMPQQLAEYNKEHKSKETYAASRGFDAFFKDETFLDATNRSYVRVRAGYEYNQRGGNSYLHNITARIRLPRTEDRLQLFIGGESKEESVLSEDGVESEHTDIGVKYFIPTLFKLLNASASVGFSGVKNPYVKGRAGYPFFFKAWLFRPVQQVMYSVKNEFQEWTNLYFDKKTSQDAMFRLLLQRSTQSGVDGMNYMLQVSYFNTRSHGVGLNRYLSINGRTKDLADPYANGQKPQEGVYSYALGMIWKQKLGRDYIYYQLQPIVDFHEEYDYKANAIFKVTLELYFGNY